MKKIAIIGTNGLPANYGGFETLAEQLVNTFSSYKVQTVVYCSTNYKEVRQKEFNGAKLIHIPLRANGWQSIIYDFISIFHAYFTCSDLIVLGFSGAFAFPFNKIFKKNIVFNLGGVEWKKVRGTLLTSKIEVLMKKLMEWLCIKYSTTVIIDNEAFNDYVKSKYNINPILAEYGGPEKIEITSLGNYKKKYPFLKRKYALSISRAQKDMNIHIVLDAFSKTPKKNIVVISNWNITDYGKSLYKDYNDKFQNIYLLNAIYDKYELNIIRENANYYIHSHSLCGTAPSLVEAMSHGLSIISFDVETNRYTTENEALYFNDVDSLVSIIDDENKKIDKLGLKMKEIADYRYKWERITNIYYKQINK